MLLGAIMQEIKNTQYKVAVENNVATIKLDKTFFIINSFLLLQ